MHLISHRYAHISTYVYITFQVSMSQVILWQYNGHLHSKVESIFISTLRPTSLWIKRWPVEVAFLTDPIYVKVIIGQPPTANFCFSGSLPKVSGNSIITTQRMQLEIFEDVFFFCFFLSHEKKRILKRTRSFSCCYIYF